MFQAVGPLTAAVSVFDDEHVSFVCLNDKKVIDSGERRLEYPQLWPSI